MKLHRRKGLVLCLIVVLLFAMVPITALGGTSEWAPNTAYKAGDVVTYQGSSYKCIQPHTSLKGWEPPNVPALWQLQEGGGTPTPTPTATPTPTSTPVPTESPSPTPTVPPANGKKVMIGYWHNFDNGSTNIRLRDVSPSYDVINVSFAEPVGNDRATMGFTPYNATQEEFKADIAYLQSKGKKVVISIGGANGAVELTSEQARNNFAKSMLAIIQTYGFDGMDIDLEGSSLSLNPGDTDFKNPTSPKIKHLISATKEILANFGSNFILSMAPETAYVQGGYANYGGVWGAYLPVIYAFKDRLTYLHVQLYNSGSIEALDGRSYSQGTPDFLVSMSDMLLQGFPVARNTNQMFPALKPEQVLIGLPASRQAASGGYTAPSDVQKALTYLAKGTSFGGAYKLRNASGYTGFKGLMTWSINWDKFNNHEFSGSHRPFLDSLK